MVLTDGQHIHRGSSLQKILIEGREHWDQPGYDANSRLRFLRAVQCRTPELGRRIYASHDEEAEFCNTCKSPACTSCGHWATIQWQRNRWWALPEGPYRVVTLTMPHTLWPLFASNPQISRKLAEIAARVIIGYARVRRGVEVGVIPILHTFNGKLEYNSHVHALVTARDLQKESSECFFWDREQLMRSWRRLVVTLLRAAARAGYLNSTMSGDEIERLLQREETRSWRLQVQSFDGKEHFLRYAGRYVRRPPIAQRRIIRISNGFVWFWYKDKRLGRRQTVRLNIEAFIDRWKQHLPKHYQHVVRSFGLFGPRRWHFVSRLRLRDGGQKGSKPKRLNWAYSIQRLSGHNPLIDGSGVQMRFVRHIPPVSIRT